MEPVNTIARSEKNGELYCTECSAWSPNVGGHETHCKSRKTFNIGGEDVSEAEFQEEENPKELVNDKWSKNSSVGIKPSYYTKYKIDPWTFCIENNVDLATGSVIKYVMRHQDKNGVEDINKAIKCLEMIREHYYA